MRNSPWIKAAVAAVLIAAQPALGQNPDDPSSPQTGPSAPGEFIEGIGNAIQNFLRGIFGGGEGEIGTPARPPSATQPQPEQAAPAPKPAAATAAPSQTLHGAIAKGDDAGAVKLIESGADIESKDPGAGASPLHYAVWKNKIALVGLLLQRGADVNSRTKSGTTPLHTAVLYDRIEVAEFLVAKGADINAKSASGATPLSLADAANFQLIAKMLRNKGAK